MENLNSNLIKASVASNSDDINLDKPFNIIQVFDVDEFE